MLNHMFSVDHAIKYGVHEAVIIQNLQFWITRNRANGENFREGRTWTYNSIKAFGELFPYLSPKQIRSSLDRLIAADVLIAANHNQSPTDRTLWYAFVNESMFLDGHGIALPSGANGNAQGGNSQLPKGARAIALQGKSLIYTDVNTDKKPDTARGSRLPEDWVLSTERSDEALKLQPSWTPEFLKQQADAFRDYWIGVPGAKGRKLDWLATWRNWVRTTGPMPAAKSSGGAWWLSPESRRAKAATVGVGEPLRGESDAAYQSRIQAAIDNGGKPPASKPIAQPQATFSETVDAVVKRSQSEASRGALQAAMASLKRPNPHQPSA